MAEFLVAELAEPQGILRELTRRLPGTAIDLFMVAPQPGGPAVARAVCQLRGRPERHETFLQALRGLDPGLRTMAAPAGTVRVNLGIPVAAMAPDSQVVAAFAVAHGFRTVWACIEDGVVFVRILAPGQVPPGAADDLRARLRRASLQAQVDTEQADHGELADRLQALLAALEGLRAPPEGF